MSALLWLPNSLSYSPAHAERVSAAWYGEIDLFVSERVASEALSLPMFPQLTLEQQQYVADKVLESVVTRAKKASMGNQHRGQAA